MATLVKDSRGRSRFWIACVTAADGRRLKKSTKETDKKKAKVIADAWQEAEDRARGGNLTEIQIRRIIQETLERVTGRKADDPTVREWLERWLQTESGAVAPATIARYRQVARDFLRSLGPRAEVRLEALTTEDFIAFRDGLLAQGLTPHSVNLTVRKVLKRPFTIALDQGFIGRNPVAGVRLLRSSKVEKHVFRPEQVARLCAAAEGDWKGLILAGYYTGQRLGDLARLRWSSVDLHKKAISFTQGKTGAKVRIPIHPELEGHLLALPAPGKPDAPVFPTLHDKPGTGRSGLSVAFKRVMEKAGIDAGQLRARRGQKGRSLSALSFHSLRHSFTSALANEGVPSELRQKFTGHASAETNAIYTHHELETLRQAVMKLPSLPTESKTAAESRPPLHRP